MGSMATRTTTRSSDKPGQGRVGGLQALVRDTMAEIRKVSWPDMQTTRNLTLVVIGMAAVLGILLGGIDALFVRIWDAIPDF
jgi:preprotein translocase subunit SecE